MSIPERPSSQLEAILASRLKDLRDRELLRVDRVTDRGGRIVFCSNDYLGLADDPRLAAAMAEGAAEVGSGSGASRLISGTRSAHRELETSAAEWMQAEAALLFNSGYQANVGTLSALLGRGDAVFSDELNHASIIDGIRLGRASRCVYPHRNVGALDELLGECETDGLKLIVTDAVFSMDGDAAPLEDLIAVAARHGAALMVDEAHSIGVLGAEGRGLAAKLGVADRIDIRVITCGKALGSFGALVVGSSELRRYLYNRARSFVYTTAPSPAVVAATLAAIRIVRNGPERAALRRSMTRMSEALSAAGWWSGDALSPIFPLIVGAEERALSLSSALDSRGFFVQAIRPPTVPAGTSRLRATVSAAHSAEQIGAFVDALVEESQRLGIEPKRNQHGGQEKEEAE